MGYFFELSLPHLTQTSPYSSKALALSSLHSFDFKNPLDVFFKMSATSLSDRLSILCFKAIFLDLAFNLIIFLAILRLMCMPCGECWSKAQPYRDQDQSSLMLECMPCGAMSSRRTEQTYTARGACARLSPLPPGSILSPPSLLWFARVTGFFKVLPPTCRIVPESGKQKTLWF